MQPVELKSRLERGEALQILDVREDYEREICKLSDHHHIPMADIQNRMSELNRQAPLVVYCKGGVRSRRVASYLVSEGFQTVYNLEGGIDAWAQVVDPSMPRY